LETEAKTKLLKAKAMLMAEENKIMQLTWRPSPIPPTRNSWRIDRK
jgi:hypothetical protein